MKIKDRRITENRWKPSQHLFSCFPIQQSTQMDIASFNKLKNPKQTLKTANNKTMAGRPWSSHEQVAWRQTKRALPVKNRILLCVYLYVKSARGIHCWAYNRSVFLRHSWGQNQTERFFWGAFFIPSITKTSDGFTALCAHLRNHVPCIYWFHACSQYFSTFFCFKTLQECLKLPHIKYTSIVCLKIFQTK